MKATKFIRLFSLLGIVTLLVLQYAWVKNSYTLMEKDFIEKSKKVLTSSIQAELDIRMKGVFKKTVFDYSDKPIDSKIVSSSVINQSIDINEVIQAALISFGKPCNKYALDSIYKVTLKEIIGFEPSYTLNLVDFIQTDSSKLSKFTFYGKITNKQYAEVILENPLGSILQQAQLIVIVSIILVIIIGLVLMYLLRSTLKEAKFVNFIKDYTHALTHELKTPISGIYIASSQLASGIFEDRPEARQKYYAVCKESSSKLLSTVDRILLVAKAERSKIAINPEEVAVKPYIDKIVDIHRSNNFRRKDVVLTSACEPAELIGTFDKFLIENVLNNLIDNAMKYSDQSVEIDVSAQSINGKLLFRIKDNGFGIAENELKHIFDNFERGSKVAGKGIDGYGIGLNYVNKVVRAHKGTIQVESREGKGTEFFIYLPV
jgi:two-component system, OmpR family, phosphate regulon sensor histidine kinase PhoR